MPSSLLPPSAAEIQQSFASRKAFVDFYHKQLDVAQLRKLCKDAGIKYAADKASAKVLCGKIYDRLHRWKWLERIGIGMSGLLGVGSGARGVMMSGTGRSVPWHHESHGSSINNCAAGYDGYNDGTTNSDHDIEIDNSTAEDGHERPIREHGESDNEDLRQPCAKRRTHKSNTATIVALLATLLTFASYGTYTTHTKRTTLRNKVVSALSTSTQRRAKRRAPQSAQKKASAKS